MSKPENGEGMEGMSDKDREMMQIKPETPEGSTETKPESLMDRVKKRLGQMRERVARVATAEGRQRTLIDEAIDRYADSDDKNSDLRRKRATDLIGQLREMERARGATEDSEFLKDAEWTMNPDQDSK